MDNRTGVRERTTAQCGAVSGVSPASTWYNTHNSTQWCHPRVGLPARRAAVLTARRERSVRVSMTTGRHIKPGRPQLLDDPMSTFSSVTHVNKQSHNPPSHALVCVGASADRDGCGGGITFTRVSAPRHGSAQAACDVHTYLAWSLARCVVLGTMCHGSSWCR